MSIGCELWVQKVMLLMVVWFGCYDFEGFLIQVGGLVLLLVVV